MDKIWIDAITAIGAITFGLWQILINRRLKSLQDYVSVVVVPEEKESKIKLLNTGKTNLYLWGFDMLDRKIRFSKPRLMTAGTGDTAYYWIDPPTDLENEKEFEFRLYLEDDFEKKWISDHGGKREGDKIFFWSHKTQKNKWMFN